eukprot:751828-Hanusia_phi.AAC.7
MSQIGALCYTSTTFNQGPLLLRAFPVLTFSPSPPPPISSSLLRYNSPLPPSLLPLLVPPFAVALSAFPGVSSPCSPQSNITVAIRKRAGMEMGARRR